MPNRLAALIMARRHPLKAEWERGLRARPPSTPLAMPDILIHRMDDTLDQLDSLLRSRSLQQWLAGHPSPLAPLRQHCRCGLSPLLDYFATGGAAMETVLTDLDAAKKNLLNQAWHLLAQREIESLCGICRRTCAPSLQFHA